MPIVLGSDLLIHYCPWFFLFENVEISTSRPTTFLVNLWPYFLFPKVISCMHNFSSWQYGISLLQYLKLVKGTGRCFIRIMLSCRYLVFSVYMRTLSQFPHTKHLTTIPLYAWWLLIPTEKLRLDLLPGNPTYILHQRFWTTIN